MSSTKNTMRTLILLGLALTLTIGSGLVQGKWQNRWGAPLVVEQAQQKLTELPGEIGNWRLQEKQELGANEQKILQNYGYLAGVYVHEQSGAAILCSVLLGPPGPTSVHTPEICWGSHTFCATGERTSLRVAGRDDTFWTTMFHSRDVSQTPRRAVYGWRYQQRWQAPEEPRISFGTSPYLYKLQIASDGDDNTSREQVQEFLNDFLPVIDSQLL